MTNREIAHQQNLQFIAEEALRSGKLPDQKVRLYVSNFLNENSTLVQELSERFGRSAEEILHFFGG